MDVSPKRILFVANNYIGPGLSGGDRIFTELMRHWSAHDHLTLMGTQEALDMCDARGIPYAGNIAVDHRDAIQHPNSLKGQVRHIIRRTRLGLSSLKQHKALVDRLDCVYSASDFFPNFWPAWKIKRMCPACTWIAGYYLFAASPWAADNPYRGAERLRNLAYWLLQRVSYPIVNRYADFVFVTSEPDVPRFVGKHRPADRVVVVRGGVDYTAADAWLQGSERIPMAQRSNTACFVGRLHYQKGVRELIQIWRRVVHQLPEARLALIGNGPLEGELRATAHRLHLDDNIDFLGFLDGPAKHRVFQQSRMVLHPATYDSGGMAAAEAMAWALPGVAFDLEALRSYYPRGMIKIPPGDLDAFAAAVIALSRPSESYDRLAAEAHELIRSQWGWHTRAGDIYRAVFGEQP